MNLFFILNFLEMWTHTHTHTQTDSFDFNAFRINLTHQTTRNLLNSKQKKNELETNWQVDCNSKDIDWSVSVTLHGKRYYLHFEYSLKLSITQWLWAGVKVEIMAMRHKWSKWNDTCQFWKTFDFSLERAFKPLVSKHLHLKLQENTFEIWSFLFYYSLPHLSIRRHQTQLQMGIR